MSAQSWPPTNRPERTSGVLVPDSIEAFKPNKFQSIFLNHWTEGRFSHVGAMAGWGAGKTRLISYLAFVSWAHGFGDGAFVTDSMGRGARTISQNFAELLGPLGWTLVHTYGGAPAPHWLSPPINGKRMKVWILSWKRPSTKSTSANSLEGPSLSWIVLDEANQFDHKTGHEVMVAMTGRVRDGNPGRVGVLGKPTHAAFWPKWCEDRGGVGFTAPSTWNKENLPGYDRWVSTLSAREFRENILALPQPPEGSIYDMWVPEVHPRGNLTSPDWKPEPWMHTFLSIDFGVRSPAAVVISHDPRIGPDGADVIWSEAQPDRASVFTLINQLKMGIPSAGIPGVWPGYRPDRPDDKIPIAYVYGDRAGRNMRDDANLTSAMDDVLNWPHGLGMQVQYTDDRSRIDVLAGIRLVWRRIEDNAKTRRLLCSHRLWVHGSKADGRTFTKSINGYEWKNSQHKAEPNKTNGCDHAMDALRYAMINARWPSDAGLNEARAAFKEAAPIVRPRMMPGSDR